MDELHASIAAHLRRQRQVRAMLRRHEEHILGLWRERCAAPRCKICGAAVDDDDNRLYNLDDMQAVRECALHYTPF